MYASFNRFEIKMTLAQAKDMSHSGSCDDDVAFYLKTPAIARQLAKINPADIGAELKEYGAWDADELADHEQNLQRLLWLAAVDMAERPGEFA